MALPHKVASAFMRHLYDFSAVAREGKSAPATAAGVAVGICCDGCCAVTPPTGEKPPPHRRPSCRGRVRLPCRDGASLISVPRTEAAMRLELPLKMSD